MDIDQIFSSWWKNIGSAGCIDVGRKDVELFNLIQKLVLMMEQIIF